MNPLSSLRIALTAMASVLPFSRMPVATENVEPRRLEPFLGEPMPRPMANFPDMPMTPMVNRQNPKRDAQKAQRKARLITRKNRH